MNYINSTNAYFLNYMNFYLYIKNSINIGNRILSNNYVLVFQVAALFINNCYTPL